MNNTETYAEMHLVFDNDYDVQTITELTKITPYECQRRCETRINSETHDHNHGFWSLKSKTFLEIDISAAIDDLVFKVKGGLMQIKKICADNQGKVIFDIVSTFDSDNVPAIYFEKSFLDIVHNLDAEIQLDLYVENTRRKTGGGSVS